MCERIRGNYDNVLYKLTCTLLYFTGLSLTVMMRCVIVQRSTSMSWMNSRRPWILPTSLMVSHSCNAALYVITRAVSIIKYSVYTE